jgi:hypothetical protein
MINLPLFIKKIIPKLKCPNCDEKMKHENVESVGFTEIGKNKNCVFLGCTCKKCESAFQFQLDDVTMVEFIFEMAEQYMEEEEKLQELEEDIDEFEEERNIPKVPKNKQKSKQKAKKRENKNKKSKISDEEVSNFIKELNSSSSYDDFLRDMKIAHNKNDNDKKWN